MSMLNRIVRLEKMRSQPDCPMLEIWEQANDEADPLMINMEGRQMRLSELEAQPPPSNWRPSWGISQIQVMRPCEATEDA